MGGASLANSSALSAAAAPVGSRDPLPVRPLAGILGAVSVHGLYVAASRGFLIESRDIEATKRGVGGLTIARCFAT